MPSLAKVPRMEKRIRCACNLRNVPRVEGRWERSVNLLGIEPVEEELLVEVEG